MLLKSALSILHTYFLSLFVIPFSIACAIEKTQRHFLWERWKDNKGIHLVAQKEVCCSKDKGGLRIKKIQETNRALLSKWLWRFGVEEDTLWHRAIAEKYRLESRWVPKMTRNAYGTSCWRAIMNQLPTFLKGISMKVRSGEHPFSGKIVGAPLVL